MSLIIRMAIFALLWWVFTEGAPSSWWIGGVFVPLAAWLSVRMASPQNFSVKGICHFLPFFMRHSLQGGIDVALRALKPGVNIAPGLVTYPLRLPHGAPQIFMANVISLLPGTLAADLEESILVVHVLDGRRAYQSELARLEEKIAQIYNITLPLVSGNAVQDKRFINIS